MLPECRALHAPLSLCLAPGPSSEVGLHLRSFRVPGGLEANLQLDKKYQAFPGAALRPRLPYWEGSR